MSRQRDGFWIALSAAIFYPLTTLIAKRVVVGAEHLPQQGGAIVVMNHVSHLDPIFDAVFLHSSGRVPRFMAKHSLFEKAVIGRVLTGAEQIPVYRGSSKAKDSLAAAKEALAEGKIILIYPEGTITRDPKGWPMVARNGIARLALESDVPVVPAARWGTLDILDIYQKKFRPFPRREVTIKFGAPLNLDAYREGRLGHSKLTAVTQLAMHRVAELLSDIRAQPAPSEFFEPKKAAPTRDKD